MLKNSCLNMLKSVIFSIPVVKDSVLDNEYYKFLEKIEIELKNILYSKSIKERLKKLDSSNYELY